MEPERLQLADISFIDPGIVFGKTAAEAVCSSEINQIWFERYFTLRFLKFGCTFKEDIKIKYSFPKRYARVVEPVQGWVHNNESEAKNWKPSRKLIKNGSAKYSK